MEEAMADFTELHVEDGVGDWHFNRFRIAFEPPKGRNLVILANSLIGFFPQFVTSEYATAEWGEHKHGDLRTVRLHGYGKVLGIDLAAPHTDWVAIVSVDPNGFTVQTLKREFGNYHEDVGG